MVDVAYLFFVFAFEEYEYTTKTWDLRIVINSAKHEGAMMKAYNMRHIRTRRIVDKILLQRNKALDGNVTPRSFPRVTCTDFVSSIHSLNEFAAIRPYSHGHGYGINWYMKDTSLDHIKHVTRCYQGVQDPEDPMVETRREELDELYEKASSFDDFNAVSIDML